MFGCSLSIPISRGKLNMGMWQVRSLTYCLEPALPYACTHLSSHCCPAPTQRFQVTHSTKHDMPNAPCVNNVGGPFDCRLTHVFCSLQGIWLCEHRDSASPREVVVTLQGQ